MRLKACEMIGLPTNEMQDVIVGTEKRHVLFRAARRVGKSFTAVKRHFPLSLCPNTLHWVVAATYDLAQPEMEYWHEFLQKLSALTGSFKITQYRNSPSAGDLLIETSLKSRIVGKSASHEAKLVGRALDSVILAEACLLKQNVWERYIRPTLSTNGGIATFATTPDEAGLWLYEMELAAADNPDWGIFTMPAWECNHYDPAEIKSAKRELSEDAFYEQYGGEWRFHAGRVYKVFRPDTHLVDPFPIPKSWQIYCGVDFGFRDPTAVVWVAQSPSGEVYVINEYYESERVTQDHVRELLNKEKQFDMKPIFRVADHHGLGRQLIQDASSLGYPTVPSLSNDRKSRRDRAISAFTPKEGRHPFHIREKGLPPGEYPDVFLFKGRVPTYVKELQFFRFRDTTIQEGYRNDAEGADHCIDASEYIYERLGVGRTVARRARTYKYKPRRVSAMTGY